MLGKGVLFGIGFGKVEYLADSLQVVDREVVDEYSASVFRTRSGHFGAERAFHSAEHIAEFGAEIFARSIARDFDFAAREFFGVPNA